MGLTKPQDFTEDTLYLSELLKTLGHPVRLSIVLHLAKVNACIGTDLVNQFDLAQTTISKHLNDLKNIGLINTENQGRSILYSINHDSWNEIEDLVAFVSEQLIKKDFRIIAATA